MKKLKNSTYAIAITLFGILGVCKSTIASQGNIILANECNQSACLEMNFDISLSSDISSILVNEDITTRGYATYTLKLKGSLNNSEEDIHEIIFESYKGGMNCSEFGVANVAVKGYSLAGNPILMTSKGALELTDTNVQIGCKDCLGIIKENSDVVESFDTPHFDLRRVKLDPFSFALSSEGSLFIRKDSEECILFNSKGNFTLADNSRCEIVNEATILPYKKHGQIKITFPSIQGLNIILLNQSCS